MSPYGVTKLAAEFYLYYYHRIHGLEYAALRYSNVYGPRQDPHGEAGVVAIFSRRILAGDPLTIYGDGEQTRDYVFVGDVAEANMAVTDADLPPATSLDDRAFNVGTGIETSVNELARVLQEAAGRDVGTKPAPERPGELRNSCLEAGKVRAAGWAGATAVRKGLETTFRYIADSEERHD
jgi:UDP-glucose 4-epimerase